MLILTFYRNKKNITKKHKELTPETVEGSEEEEIKAEVIEDSDEEEGEDTNKCGRMSQASERPRVFVEIDASATPSIGPESGDPPAPSPRGIPHNSVSARDAVLGEVLVEEQLATELRMRQEAQEEQAARGWWGRAS